MVLKRKYVIISGKGAILFPETFQHAEFRKHGEITGAGFFFIGDNDKVTVYGESISLKIKSKSEDLFWVKQALGLSF